MHGCYSPVFHAPKRPAPALSGPRRNSIGVKCSTLGIVTIMKCDKMNRWHHLVVGVDVTRVVPRDAGVGGSYVQPRNGHLLLSPRKGRRCCLGTKGLAFPTEEWHKGVLRVKCQAHLGWTKTLVRPSHYSLSALPQCAPKARKYCFSDGCPALGAWVTHTEQLSCIPI